VVYLPGESTEIRGKGKQEWKRELDRQMNSGIGKRFEATFASANANAPHYFRKDMLGMYITRKDQLQN
jgi:hypothetical protein